METIDASCAAARVCRLPAEALSALRWTCAHITHNPTPNPSPDADSDNAMSDVCRIDVTVV